MCHRISSRLASKSFSHHGLSDVRFGRMLSNLVIRGFQRMSCSSAKNSFRWYTTTECSGGVAPLCISQGLSQTIMGVRVASALAQCGLASPVPGSSVSPRHVCPCVVETESPRKTRRVHRRIRPTRIRDKPVRVPSPATADRAVQDLTGAVIYDGRPRILPVSIQLKDIGHPSRVRPTVSASLATPTAEDTMVIGSASPERAAIPEFSVTPSDDPGTDL